jgi:diguanylate cyclase (GGDEF)-like protein
MYEPQESPNVGDGTHYFRPYSLLLIGLSLAAVGGAFWLSKAAIDDRLRLIGFAGLVIVFVGVWTAVVVRKPRRESQSTDLSPGFEETERSQIDESAAESPLTELDEAREFFSGSLKLADAFRLISHRVRDVMPFRGIVLFLLNDRRTQVIAAHADGVSIEDVDGGLAGQSHLSNAVAIDSYLEMDATQAFGSSAAIPLRNHGNVFAVLQLYFGHDHDAANVDKYLFEVVGERVAPLVLSSLSSERSHANALTDITTDLPNERAFFMMLEKQIAEAHHNRSADPLTVLALDIKNFDEINARYGHAAGDDVLRFVAQVTKGNLRQMDFLARSVNDEFLAILPTASIETSQMIIERIYNCFVEEKFVTTGGESISVDLNIGWATYDNEGSTPGELLSLAELKKEQQKMPIRKNIVAFPQEFVN